MYLPTVSETGKKHTCGDKSHESRQPLSARVTTAPAMVLRAVDQINISVAQDGYRRKTSSFCVRVHAFNDQHLVVDVIHTFVGLPVGPISAVLISNNTC